LKKIAKTLLYGLIAACTCMASLHAQSGRTPKHPLDALTTSEYWTVHDVLEQSGHLTDKTLFSSVLLHEPNKNTVLSWKDGDSIPREADVILEDSGRTIEARVDIASAKLEFWKEVKGVQAPITISELDTMSDVAKHDARVVAALKEHGITDLSSVRCEPIPLTFRVFPEQANHRIGYGDCTDSHSAYHPWGRAVEGLYIVADLTAEKILDVINQPAGPMPKGDTDYEEGDATPRNGTKPLLVTQPEGPGYKIDKGEIIWQNWHFRFRLDPRVGPVLNLVHYQDGDRLRSILYEGSLSEMYVPYMDPDDGWNTRVFLDAGEFLLGGLIKPVGPDDCPAHAQYFTGIVPSDKGAPVLKPQMACLFEHATDSPAWRHSEDGLISGRPSRELVLRTSAVAGNYDYLMDWIFQQDGTIRVAVGATGIVETKAVKETVIAHQMGDEPSKLENGTLVAPNLLAVNHDHYFSYRLDLDVDGPKNSFMIDRLVPEKISGKARKEIWASQSSMAHTEKDAILDVDLRHPGMWHFINPNQHGTVGYSTGYEIMPGATAVSNVSSEDPAQKMGAFSEHQMWVTPYRPDELYAAGTYVTTNNEPEGLATWTKANRSIENTDIVGWYTLGFHHVVRLEDWPIMPTLWHEFLIRPANFFDQNPTLTLPHQP
jgi:primary-amine oxidase